MCSEKRTHGRDWNSLQLCAEINVRESTKNCGTMHGIVRLTELFCDPLWISSHQSYSLISAAWCFPFVFVLGEYLALRDLLLALLAFRIDWYADARVCRLCGAHFAGQTCRYPADCPYINNFTSDYHIYHNFTKTITLPVYHNFTKTITYEYSSYRLWSESYSLIGSVSNSNL